MTTMEQNSQEQHEHHYQHSLPDGTRITIRLPDDFHHHARDGPKTASILQHATERFGRVLLMPNLKPPVTNVPAALRYEQHVQASLATISNNNGMSHLKHFQPLFTLYLTDRTTADDIHQAVALMPGRFVACKYYPAGATTNSEFGVTDIRHCYPALQAMAKHDLVLCIHSEVTDADIFEREPVFLERILKPLVRDVPNLKITLEHISTAEAVQYICNEAPDHVKASITCHHLLYNRNDLLARGGLRPHLYCLPILKAEPHRQALVQAAISGNPKFFAGTDSAPHEIAAKETVCACAGVYTAHAAIELYASVFERAGAIDKLEPFCSVYGAQHYGLPLNTATLTLEKKAWTVPESYDFGEGGDGRGFQQRLKPLCAGETIAWSIMSLNDS